MVHNLESTWLSLRIDTSNASIERSKIGLISLFNFKSSVFGPPCLKIDVDDNRVRSLVVDLATTRTIKRRSDTIQA